MNILDQYLEELQFDTKLDEFTVKDVQMKLPGIKHKWSGRLIRGKMDISRLYSDKDEAITEISKELISKSPVKISDPIARKKAEEHTSVLILNRKIREMELVIEFCEKAEKILSSMTYDIRNLCDIMKLETQ